MFLEVALILPDLLSANLKVVFCGTAPSVISAQRQAYYAHPQNKFYRILYEAGFTDQLLTAEEYPKLLNYGIGLTDVNKSEQGNDVDLTRAGFSPEALQEKMMRYQPVWLAFTSKRAAREGMLLKASDPLDYGEQKKPIGQTRLFVLPSTSGAASGSWDAKVWSVFSQKVIGL